MFREPQEWTRGVQGSHWSLAVLLIKVLLIMWWPEGEVPSEGALSSSGFLVLMICNFFYFVYTFKPNYCKLSTDLNHRHKPNHWTLCSFFLPPSHWHLHLSLTSPPLRICLPQTFPEPLIFFSQFSFPFGVFQSACFCVSSHHLSIQTFAECLTGLHR